MTADDVIAVIDLYDREIEAAARKGDVAAVDRIGTAFHAFAAMQPLAYRLVTDQNGDS